MKTLLTVTLTLLLAISAFAGERSVGQGFRFVYNIVDAAGAHVSSQTPNVRIQKVSNGHWYDFADSSFKASGWTNKTTNLTEDSTNGVYYYQWTPPAAETSSEQYLFVVNNSDATYGDHASLLVSYDDIINAINRARGR